MRPLLTFQTDSPSGARARLPDTPVCTTRTSPVFGSSRPTLPAQFQENQTAPVFRSMSSQCNPGSIVMSCRGCIGGGAVFGIRYEITLPVCGSSLPMNGLRLIVNQICPSASATTSCTRVGAQGSSYSVTTARVAGPVGRGNGLSGGISESSPRIRDSQLITISASALLCRYVGSGDLRKP